MKKNNRFFQILLILIFMLVIRGLSSQYIYKRLDTSNFPLKRAWSSHLNEPIVELSVDDKGLFILARTTNALYALDTITGQELWRFQLIYHQSVTFPAISHNGIVYIADAKNLWALDQINGEVIWSQPLTEPRGKVEDVLENVVFVNNRNTDVGAYEIKTGLLLWSLPLYWYHPKIYIREGQIYIPKNGLHIVNIATGVDIVKNKEDFIIDSSTYSDEIYYATLDNIVAFNTETEDEIWRQKRTFSDNEFPRLDVHEQFIIIESEKSLSLLNKETGGLIWTKSVSYPTNPSVIGDTIFVMEGYSRVIRAFQITSGTEIGQLRTSFYLIFPSGQQDMIAIDNMLIFSRGDELLGFTSKDSMK